MGVRKKNHLAGTGVSFRLQKKEGGYGSKREGKGVKIRSLGVTGIICLKKLGGCIDKKYRVGEGGDGSKRGGIRVRIKSLGSTRVVCWEKRIERGGMGVVSESRNLITEKRGLNFQNEDLFRGLIMRLWLQNLSP